MHLYDEPAQLQCPNCKRWWKPGNVSCAVLHLGKGCCHSGDVEVPAPEPKCTGDYDCLVDTCDYDDCAEARS